MVSCRLSATGIRFSGHPHPAEDFRLPHGRPTEPGAIFHTGPDHNGVPTFHTYELRPDWVPSRPRGRRCSPDRMPCPIGACRFPAANPYTLLAQPIDRAAFYEASTKVHAIHPPGLPLARDPRMERGPFGFLSGFAPHRYQ